MSVYLDGTDVILDGGSVATDAGCCCDEALPCPEYISFSDCGDGAYGDPPVWPDTWGCGGTFFARRAATSEFCATVGYSRFYNEISTPIASDIHFSGIYETSYDGGLTFTATGSWLSIIPAGSTTSDIIEVLPDPACNSVVQAAFEICEVIS